MGREIELVDTAGLRRKAKVADKLEKLSTSATLRTLKFAEVVALIVDATAPLERQDLTIARLVAQEGRALVIVLNKWDLIADPNAAMAEIRAHAGDPAGRRAGRALRAAVGADRPQRRQALAGRGGRARALGQAGCRPAR